MSNFCHLLRKLDTKKAIVISNKLLTTDWRWCDNDPRYKIKKIVQRGDDFNSAKLMIDIVHSASGELIITDEIKTCVLETLNKDREHSKSRKSRLTNPLIPTKLTRYCKLTDLQAYKLLFERTTTLSLINVSLTFDLVGTSGSIYSYDVTVTPVETTNSIVVCTYVDSQALPPSLEVFCCFLGPLSGDLCAKCTTVDANPDWRKCGPCQAPSPS